MATATAQTLPNDINTRGDVVLEDPIAGREPLVLAPIGVLDPDGLVGVGHLAAVEPTQLRVHGHALERLGAQVHAHELREGLQDTLQ